MWYVKIADSEVGPLNAKSLIDLLKRGRVRSTDVVRIADSVKWEPLSKLHVDQRKVDKRSSLHHRRWLIRCDKGVVGPLTDRELKLLADVEIVNESTLLKYRGIGRWRPARLIPGLKFGRLICLKGQGNCSSPGESLPDSRQVGRNRVTAVPEWSESSRVHEDLTANRGPQLSGVLGQSLFLALLLTFAIPAFGPPIESWAAFSASVIASVVLSKIFILTLSPSSDVRRFGGAVFAFTAFFGAPSLFQLISYAVEASTSSWTLRYPITSIAAFIGRCYMTPTHSEQAYHSVGDWGEIIVRSVLTIGILEESIKLLPILFLCLQAGKLDRRTALFVGAMSGLGFGGYEGLVIAHDVYIPEQVEFSMLITRFFGCSFGHAVFTALSSAIFSRIVARSNNNSVELNTALMAYLGAVALLAIPHGLYDALLIAKTPILPGVVVVSMVFVLIWTSRLGVNGKEQMSMALR